MCRFGSRSCNYADHHCLIRDHRNPSVFLPASTQGSQPLCASGFRAQPCSGERTLAACWFRHSAETILRSSRPAKAFGVINTRDACATQSVACGRPWGRTRARPRCRAGSRSGSWSRGWCRTRTCRGSRGRSRSWGRGCRGSRRRRRCRCWSGSCRCRGSGRCRSRGSCRSRGRRTWCRTYCSCSRSCRSCSRCGSRSRGCRRRWNRRSSCGNA